MDPSRFDHLAIQLTGAGTRRRLLGLLAALPVAGVLLTASSPEEADARGRRRRRVKPNRRSARRRKRQRQRQRRRRHAGKKRCTPHSVALTCNDMCGTVANNCGQAVDCGPCPCPTGLSPAADLQAAIDKAPTGATLTLCAGTWSLPAPLQIARPLTLAGAGADQTILDGREQHRVLQVSTGAQVTVQALTITRGMSAFGGGGIYNEGDLTLIDAAVSANTVQAAHPDGGGGIITSGSLTLRNTLVTRNTSDAAGGGIRMEDGILRLEAGTRIERNEAAGMGGGMYLYRGMVTLAGDSSITNNTAQQGGGIYNSTASITLEQGSRIAANEAPHTGGISNFGGLITAEPGALICENSDPQCSGEPIDGDCPNPVGACPP